MNGTPPCILAIDHGTSGMKTALVSVRGEVLGAEFEPTRVHWLPGGGAEQDPEEWWSALLASAGRLLGRGIVRPQDVVGVGCSSTFSTTVACDEAGRPVLPAMTWLDARGSPHVRRLMRGLVNVMGYGVTNLIRFLPPTGGGPTLSGKDDIAHVLYWREERPEAYRAARWFMSSKDYLNLRLTGTAAASFDSMALFWVTDNRDANDVRYHPGLIRRLGLDPTRLPPIRRSTDVLGPLMPEVADSLGLPRGTPVVAGASDLQSACVGSGAVRDFDAHIYLGTSSWLLCHVPFKKTDILHSIASLPSAIPGRYFAANEQDQAGGCLDFLMRNILFHRSALRPDAAPGEAAWAALDEVATSVPPGSRGVVFTPWLNGEKTPLDDEHLRGGFHNLSTRTTMDDLVRSVFEGVAYNLRWVLGYVEGFCGRRLDPLNLVGGGARLDVWPRILADVLGRTIRRVEHPLHANARGAALIAAVGLGHIASFDEVPGLVRFDRVLKPCEDETTRAAYDRGYRAFTEIARRMRPICRWLNA